jgi:hypothetical protein
MRIRMPGLVLSGAILAGALVNTSLFRTDVAAQSDAIWVNVSQGEDLLAAMTVQPLRQVRRDEIRPIGAVLSMAPRITTVAPTAVRVPATALDYSTPLSVDGFMLRSFRSNGTAYVQVASISGGAGTGERESPMLTIALLPGETRELAEAKALGAAPITLSAATSAPARR